MELPAARVSTSPPYSLPNPCAVHSRRNRKPPPRVEGREGPGPNVRIIRAALSWLTRRVERVALDPRTGSGPTKRRSAVAMERIRSFKHSGKMGDIIYSLPAIKAVGGGAL